jgi:hypothetical protein
MKSPSNQEPIALLPHEDAVKAITLMLEHLADWPMRSAEAFRNTILGDGLLAINPMLNIHEEKDVKFLRHTLKQTVAEGRMVDFGFIPNDVIKAESIRSRHMFEAGEFQHPYESWLAVSSWEGGFNGYFIAPNWQHGDKEFWALHGLNTLVMELYGVSLPNGRDAILVYDIVSIAAKGIGNTIVSPAAMIFPHGHKETEQEIRNRGSNSLDPLVTMLRLLADASIPVVYKEEPVRLNVARAKQGKHKIPGHTVVQTRDYVATFTHAGSKRGEAKGGHHASPIAHWRRAHQRHLADGRVVLVRPSKVNWRSTEELHRMFYRVDEKDGAR